MDTVTFRQLRVLSLVALAAAVSPVQSAKAQVACIWTDRAEFHFPVDTQRIYEWNARDSIAYVGRPEFAWAVEWHPPYERFGYDPHILWIIIGWQPTGPRSGPLSALLADARVEVGTFCRPCGTPAAAAVIDSAVGFQLRDNILIFLVHGSNAVSRIFFPVRPDSVVFTRRCQVLKRRSGKSWFSVSEGCLATPNTALQQTPQTR